MRILFMGSPELAVPSLLAAGEVGTVIGVFTQPPKASGRGRKITHSAVSIEALRKGIPVLTPESLKTGEACREVRDLKPDIVVTAAYGKILPPDILAVPRLGCVNVHASILPELRGAAPIQWAIARGYKETGVTLMQMDEGMDTGPILLQAKTAIGAGETAGELGARLGRMGAELLQEGLLRIERGEIVPLEQDSTLATYAPLLKKTDGIIDWSMGAEAISNRVRGFSPWPGTWTTRAGSRILITKAVPLEEPSPSQPGTVTATGRTGIHVSCGTGTLNILCVKPEGKREMEIREFIAGHKVNAGETFGS